MEPIRLFEVEVGGQKTVATAEMLATIEVDIDGASVFLDSEEKVALLFGEGVGRWVTITLKPVWTGEDEMAVERAITVWRPESNRFERDTFRYLPALVCRAVEKWEGVPELSEAVFNQMPAALRNVVADAVRQRCYPSLLDHEVFTKRSTRL